MNGLLLSLLMPGLGHVFGGRTGLGVVLYLGLLLLGLANSFGQVLFRYAMVILGGLFLLALLSIHVDAVRLCLKCPSLRVSSRRGFRAGYLAVVLLHIAFLAAVVSPPVKTLLSSQVHDVTGRGLYRIPTGSMQPGLLLGDFVVVDLQVPPRVEPQRGDIVMYNQEGSLYAKRVLALGGETIEGRGGQLSVNGSTIEDPWKLRNPSAVLEGLAEGFGPISVPEESVFVLGDNRSRSRDSRSFGPVPLSRIKGKLLFVAWSSRWERIGLRLE